MNVNWISFVILYGWLLAGLYAVKLLKSSSQASSYQVLLSYFIGPFGLGWIWMQENKETIQHYLDFKKTKTTENTDYLNLVFLDSHGRDLFSGRQENSQIVGIVKKMVYEAVSRRSSDIFIDP